MTTPPTGVIVYILVGFLIVSAGASGPVVPMCVAESTLWADCWLHPRLTRHFMRPWSTPAERRATRDALNSAFAAVGSFYSRHRDDIVSAVMVHLDRTERPLFLVFQGQGKEEREYVAELTAKLFSLALSLHCHPLSPACDRGDSLLDLQSTSYTASGIIIRGHVSKFPHGIVLLGSEAAANEFLIQNLVTSSLLVIFATGNTTDEKISRLSMTIQLDDLHQTGDATTPSDQLASNFVKGTANTVMAFVVHLFCLLCIFERCLSRLCFRLLPCPTAQRRQTNLETDELAQLHLELDLF